MILETFFLHQRGRAFTFYTMSAGFGGQSGTTFSGFIANSSAWPVQFWWTVAVEAVVVLLVAFFLDDTGFSCEDSKRKLRRPESWIMCRLAILSPYKNFTSRESSYWKAITPTVLISICPVTILTGIFIMVALGWSVVMTVLLSIFLQTPIEEGGYGFTALQNAAFTFSAWFGTVVGQIYGILVNDLIPLWLSSSRRYLETRISSHFAHPLPRSFTSYWVETLWGFSAVSFTLYGSCAIDVHYHFLRKCPSSNRH